MIGITGSLINGLKGQPILLAVLVLNALMLGLVFWALGVSAGNRAKETELLIKACLQQLAPREPRP